MTNKKSNPPNPDQLAVSFGRRLATLRGETGIDGTNFAKKVGMSQAYLWKLENGRAHPNLRTLARLAIGLEVPMAQLVDGLDYESVALENRAYERDGSD